MSKYTTHLLVRTYCVMLNMSSQRKQNRTRIHCVCRIFVMLVAPYRNGQGRGLEPRVFMDEVRELLSLGRPQAQAPLLLTAHPAAVQERHRGCPGEREGNSAGSGETLQVTTPNQHGQDLNGVTVFDVCRSVRTENMRIIPCRSTSLLRPPGCLAD